MIIQNGTIEVKSKSAGGIDPETGYPIPSGNVTWGEPIPCQWQANKYNNLGKSEGGNFTVAHYSILIESEKAFTAEQIMLRDNYGNVLGEFSIIEVEVLQAMCQMRIMV